MRALVGSFVRVVLFLVWGGRRGGGVGGEVDKTEDDGVDCSPRGEGGKEVRGNREAPRRWR